MQALNIKRGLMYRHYLSWVGHGWVFLREEKVEVGCEVAERRRSDLHCPDSEDSARAKFLLHLQLQLPEDPDRQEQHSDVKHHIEHSREDQARVEIHACARQRRVPSFLDRRAVEDLDDEPDEVEQRVEGHEGDDEPVDGAAGGGGEDAFELDQDRELEEDNAGAVEDVAEILPL